MTIWLPGQAGGLGKGGGEGRAVLAGVELVQAPTHQGNFQPIPQDDRLLEVKLLKVCFPLAFASPWAQLGLAVLVLSLLLVRVLVDWFYHAQLTIPQEKVRIHGHIPLNVCAVLAADLPPFLFIGEQQAISWTL